MRESYSYKDILFGLYNEYVILQEQLDSLNKYILLEENNLEKVKFGITDGIDDNVRMLCYLYDKRSKLDKLLDRLNIIYDINFIASYVDLFDGDYNILQYPDIIDKSRKEEFNQGVLNILNSEFGKNMKLIHNGVGYDGIPYLSLNSHGLFTCMYDVGYLSLDCSKDLYLHAYSSKGRLTKGKVEFMLNNEFSNKRFPEYYRDLIEDNDLFNKKVDIVGDFGYSRNGKFEIVPESKRLVLVKK